MGGSSISGKEIAGGTGKLFDMLAGIFSGEASPRDFEITFNAAPDGGQVNECRDLLVAFEASPSLASGHLIAERLQGVTDNRSGIGLLFLLAGTQGLKKRVVVSRFPTEQAVLAEVSSAGLDVEFLEQVFIKKLSSYKAVMLQHPTPKDGFWKGMATDRQAGQSGEHISDYWLKDFLNADFSETAAAGTRRLATALKQALKANPNLSVKAEIAHASSLAPAVFLGKSLTIGDFCDHFGLSNAAKETIRNQLSKPSLFGKMFQFEPNEFKNVAPFRTIEMSNGAILTAPNEDFEKVFETKEASDGVVEYTTRGRVSDQRLARK
ncbi:hypothetical protein P6144_17105 [Sphingomonas sp. HITSZ_GF]|uniref:hypothetical protein n=1 Tax=Sphingomonas sp. HITSZ_GF TaxID=3037247 RepID=UPI00240D7FD8|nr:hypothetical protein [Sphingomonas sp. HITSZ_GF]MDG2535382.1 hypothetical protein [Sphingomonas sp. HITSZ_GF]